VSRDAEGSRDSPTEPAPRDDQAAAAADPPTEAVDPPTEMVALVQPSHDYDPSDRTPTNPPVEFLRPSRAELAVGDIFAGRRIDDEIGRGEMGIVYRVTNLGLDRTEALKIIAPKYASDPQYQQRFAREAQHGALAEAPNIVTVYDVGEADGRLYISMQYGGTDLRQLLTEGPIEPERAVRIIRQVCSALDVVHERGVVHRDVKPANIFVSGPKGNEQVVMGDFGVSRRLTHPDLTQAGTSIGTPHYASPETQLGRAADDRSDVYSLGCTLFEMVTGRKPYPRLTPGEVVDAHIHDERPSASALASDVPPALSDVIAKAMAKDPADRYQSADAFGQAALAALDPKTDTVYSPTEVPDPETFAAPPTTVIPIQERAASTQETAVTTPTSRPPPETTAIPIQETAASTQERAVTTPTSRPPPPPTTVVPRTGHLVPEHENGNQPSPRRRVWLAAGIVVLVLAGGLAYALTRHPPPQHWPVYHADGFTFSYPTGWTPSVMPEDGYTRVLFSDPSTSAIILVDHTPSVTSTPWEEGIAEQNIVSGEPGYHTYSYTQVTIAGQPAAEWVVNLPAGGGLLGGVRIDIFRNIGTDGFATLGVGGDLTQTEQYAKQVAASITRS
jgi:serine/threonine protein kinase